MLLYHQYFDYKDPVVQYLRHQKHHLQHLVSEQEQWEKQQQGVGDGGEFFLNVLKSQLE